MFDLQADDGSVRKTAYKSPIPGGGAQSDEPATVAPNKLDGEPMRRLHTRLLGQFTEELDKQYANRVERAEDEDFYDNIQYTEADAAELEERGQKAIVYNVISASVDWVINTEKRSRTDDRVLPRRKEEGEAARKKTELMKYLSDANRDRFHKSRAFEDAVKSGLGWLEDGVSDEGDEEPIYGRYEDWRNMLHDSLATAMDLTDARYIFRAKWTDVDVACAMFRKRKGVIHMAAQKSNDFIALDEFGDEVMDSHEEAESYARSTTTERVHGWDRRRVRLIEAWFQMPVDVKRFRNGPFKGEIYDPLSRGHQTSLEEGEGELVTKTMMRMHVAILTSAGMLWFSESPYRHNRFPFTPIWGKRRRRDGQPYGIIRGLKGMQEDINKRASKALYILSTNKVIMDDNALPDDTDLDEFREEVARPDSILVKRHGSHMELNADTDLSQYQLEMMSRSISMIQQVSGVTDEQMGRSTNAKSGVAIQRRQDQGSAVTAGYFDNLRFSSQVRGEKKLSLIEQFMSEQKSFRITNSRGQPEYVEVNDGLPENDIVRSKADYVLDDADWRASLRQAEVDALLEVMVRLPAQVGIVLLDLVVENMDLSNRDALVKRIRSITGQRDPDADEPSEEEIAQQQEQQEMAKLNKATIMAELRKKIADAAKSEGDAARAGVEVEKLLAEIVGTNVDSQHKALNVAREAVTLPPNASHIGDHVLAESGFVAASDRAASQQLQLPPPQPGEPTGLAGQPGAPPEPQPPAPPPPQPLNQPAQP